MPACVILALIALVTGPNTTRLRLVQFMPVTRAINALAAMLHVLIIQMESQCHCWILSLQLVTVTWRCSGLVPMWLNLQNLEGQ